LLPQCARLELQAVNSPWDDAICLKSCYGLGFLARSTDHVTITNCYVTRLSGRHAARRNFQAHRSDDKAPRNGRIKLGTESNGGFRNITFSNWVIDDCRGWLWRQ